MSCPCPLPLQVSSASQDFLSQLGRHTYVTPTSYLELLRAFRYSRRGSEGDVASHLRSNWWLLVAMQQSFAQLQVNPSLGTMQVSAGGWPGREHSTTAPLCSGSGEAAVQCRPGELCVCVHAGFQKQARSQLGWRCDVKQTAAKFAQLPLAD